MAVSIQPLMICSGDDVHEVRANAYAGMHRKQVVRLSKDSLNQLDQISRIPKRDALNSRDASPIPASVPGHPEDAFSSEVLPNAKYVGSALKDGSSSNVAAASAANDEAVDVSANGDDIRAASRAAAGVIDISTTADGGHSTTPDGGRSTTPNGGHRNGGYASEDEMKQNGLTMGMSSDLDALFAEAGIASDGSSIGSKQQEDIKRPAEGGQMFICLFMHSCIHSFLLSLAHSLTPSLTRSLTHSLTHSLARSLALTHSFFIKHISLMQIGMYVSEYIFETLAYTNTLTHPSPNPYRKTS